jgi:hypothetical protein
MPLPKPVAAPRGTVLALAAGLLGASVLLAAPAAADEPRDRARALVGEGLDRLQAGDHAQAAALFRRAYAAYPSPSILYNVGLAEQSLGHRAEAYRAFHRFLRDAGSGASARRRENALAFLHSLRPQLAFVDLVLDVAGAQVTVDGALLATSPLSESLVLEPGIHQLDVELEGRRPFRRQLRLAAGSSDVVVVTLSPLELAAPPTRVPPTPPSRPISERRPLGVGFWVSAGLTAALGVATIATGALALSKHGEFENAPPGPARDSARSSGQAYQIAANVCLGLAVASAGVAVWQFFARPARRERRATGGPRVQAAIFPFPSVSLRSEF